MSRLGPARRLVLATSALTLPLATALAATTVSTAHAYVGVAGHTLAVSSTDAFVVDGAHSHLLFGSAAQNGVLVTDLSGTTVTTLAGAGTINDIVLSPDGTHAYAASAALDKIYQLDLGTLTVSHTYALPANDCPDSVTAVSATVIAFGYACNGGPGGMGVLSTSDSSVHTGGSYYYYPLVRAVPGTTQVVMASRQSSEAITGLYETSSGTPVLLHDTSNQTYGLGDCEYLDDLAVSPDGTSILTACGSPYRQVEYGIADFLPVASYPTNPYPTAVAYSPDGAYAAAGMDGIYGNDVALFHHTASDSSLAYAVDYTDSQTAGPTTPATGLAFSADSQSLYALAYDDTVTPHTVTLRTLPLTDPGSGSGGGSPVTPPSAPPTTPLPFNPPGLPVMSTVSVAGPYIGTVGSPLTLTGRLWLGDNSTLAGKVLAVSTAIGGVTTTGTATVDAAGGFTYTLQPTSIGTLRTTVGFAGDASHRSSTGSASVSVVRTTPHLALGAAKLHGKVYTVTAHLTGWYGSPSVRILAGKKVIAHAVVTPGGLVSVHYTRKAATKLTAVLDGDADNGPASAAYTLR